MTLTDKIVTLKALEILYVHNKLALACPKLEIYTRMIGSIHTSNIFNAVHKKHYGFKTFSWKVHMYHHLHGTNSNKSVHIAFTFILIHLQT